MLENTEGAIKNGHSRKLAAQGTQNEEKENNNNTQYVSHTLHVYANKHK